MLMKYAKKVALGVVGVLAVGAGAHPLLMSRDLKTIGQGGWADSLSQLDQLLARDLYAGTYNYYNQPESDLYMLIGYPSTTVYNALNSGGNGPPPNGLLGVVSTMAGVAISAVKASGVTSCASVPTSGTLTTSTTVNGATDSVTIAYAPATHTIPAGYTGAGSAYKARVNITMNDASMGQIKMGMEFPCGQDGAYVEMSVPGYNQSWTGAATRLINMYIDSNDPTNQQTEFMMTVTQASKVYDSQLIRLNINKSTGVFKLSAVNTFFRGSSPGTAQYQGYRLGIVGNSTTNQSSTYLTVAAPAGSSTPVAGTTVDYTTNAPSSAAFSTSFTWGAATYQGCLNFATMGAGGTGGSDPSTTALCSGLALATPSAPLIDATGGFDYTWVTQTMPTKVSIGF